ncbi:MAG TPA: hypothetical protein VGM26_00500 [Rhizomicrobium sp.]
MAAWRFAVAFVVVTLMPAAAQAPAEPDPVAQAFLSQLPSEQAAQVSTGVVSYSKASKAWWIESRCHLAVSMNAGNFSDDLASLTRAMNTLFRVRLNLAADKAQEQVEYIQMYALEQMSSAKFFGCGDQAKAVLQQGYAETERYANFAREHAAGRQ